MSIGQDNFDLSSNMILDIAIMETKFIESAYCESDLKFLFFFQGQPQLIQTQTQEQSEATYPVSNEARQKTRCCLASCIPDTTRPLILYIVLI